MNIWSHVLGLIYFTLLQINDNFHFLPENGADAGDHFTFTVMNLCFQVMNLGNVVHSRECITLLMQYVLLLEGNVDLHNVVYDIQNGGLL